MDDQPDTDLAARHEALQSALARRLLTVSAPEAPLRHFFEFTTPILAETQPGVFRIDRPLEAIRVWFVNDAGSTGGAVITGLQFRYLDDAFEPAAPRADEDAAPRVQSTRA